MTGRKYQKGSNSLRLRVRRIIFDADTPAGKAYDIVLILTIAASVSAVMLDSIDSINRAYGRMLYLTEWFFTILFTIDYIVRLICVKYPGQYVRSFFGTVDFLGVIPTYLSLIFPGAHYLVAIRYLRVLRIFRVFKLVAYLEEAQLLLQSMRNSRRKITVFLFTVFTIIVVLGSLMYVIEGAKNGFTSIPRSIYWAIVTLTTVGYGDISPQTPLGQAVAAVIMVLGYSIIVIPTGFVTVDMVQAPRKMQGRCPECGKEGHDIDAKYCKYCGGRMRDFQDKNRPEGG